jgi:threonine synthase
VTGGPATAVVCAGCGWRAPADEPLPFRCRRADGDDVDHLMVRELDPTHVSFPEIDDEEPNPFVRYRELFHGYHLGRGHGMSDEEHVHLVQQLDKAIAEVDGSGFVETPFARSDVLSDRLGCEVWVKDETGNVSGSHKARHLMGLMVHLLVVEQVGLAGSEGRELAIASCGNAALAAAVVARAAERPIRVFVPTWADEAVLRRLRELGAAIDVREREEGVPGDPTYHALRQAIADGAIPFTCQGPDNGLTIEGGETLGYEMVSQLAREGAALDRLIVQVGGGALASSCVRAFEDAALLEAPERLPRIDAVQTRNAHPLERAYRRVRQHAGHELTPQGAIEAMAWARSHRSEVMWPWEEEPRSVATGILDDETYDWAAVVAGMLATDGTPVLVDEETLEEANDLGRAATGIDVDHTGSAGLAGLLELSRRAEIRPDERVGVLFTGVRRA